MKTLIIDEIEKTLVIFIASIIINIKMERNEKTKKGVEDLFVALKLCKYFLKITDSNFEKLLNDLTYFLEKDNIEVEDISTSFEKIGFKPVNIGPSREWQTTLAPYIWHFTHLISPIIDLEGATIQKITYIYLLPKVIICPICKAHYIKSLPKLQESLKYHSLTNIMLAFHTSVNNRVDKEKIGQKVENEVFKVSEIENLINVHYKQMYMNSIYKYAFSRLSNK